jgi:predicted DCC family thiol-disulfide oxidoreductase YuxK
MTSREPIEIWYDGSCPICRRSRQWSEKRDRDDRLRFRDFRSTADRLLPADRRRHEATMMVRTPHGKLLEGFAAWRRILAQLPGWRWMARLTGLPPFRWIGSLGYRFVARWRHLLAMPLPRDPD